MRSTTLVGIALTFAACQGDSTAPAAPPSLPPRIAGSYALATVDGQALPLTVVDLGAYQVQLISGALTLDSVGTYALEVGYRTDDGGAIRIGRDAGMGIWYTIDDLSVLTSTEVPAAGVRRVPSGSRSLTAVESP